MKMNKVLSDGECTMQEVILGDWKSRYKVTTTMEVGGGNVWRSTAFGDTEALMGFGGKWTPQNFFIIKY